MFNSGARSRGLRSSVRGAATVAALSIAATTAPAILASPVQASTPAVGDLQTSGSSVGGCTVTPLKPVFAGHNSAGVKQVKATVKINCPANRKVRIQQQLLEDDGAKDQHIASWHWVWKFGQAGGKSFSPSTSLPDTEAGNEEMYQRMRFQVCIEDVCTPWTAWKNSGITSMPN